MSHFRASKVSTLLFRNPLPKMVKVLENKIVDLDLLPGQAQIDLQRQFRSQIQNAKTAGGQVQEAMNNTSSEAGEGATEAVDGAPGPVQGVQIPKEMLPDTLSDEQKEQARGIAGTIVDGSGNVIGGLVGTVGGVLKGVGDTAGNTVYSLGEGLGKTGMGLAGGLTNTAVNTANLAKAPFAGTTKPQAQSAPDLKPKETPESLDDDEKDAMNYAGAVKRPVKDED